MRALVTGATGFIGSHIVQHLLARGDRVCALVRQGSDTRHLAQQRVHLIQGDLTDPATLVAAVDGIDVVYHAAALGKSHTPTAIVATNVTGTKNLLAACAKKAVGRFVYISSVSVYVQSLAPLVDEHTPHGAIDVYGRSKSDAERSVHRYARTCGMTYSILRPCRVYGEPYNYHTTRLLRAMRGPVLIVGSARCPYYNLVHAFDVAAAAVLAGTRPEAAGLAFNITDGRGASRKEIAQTLRNLSGRRQVILTVPKRLVEYVYTMHSAFQAYRTHGGKAQPSTQWQQLFSGQRYDISRARHILGYEPQVDLQEGLRRTLAWYGQRGK
jgi:nucleoside-diphosphate-sugar epimerase